MNDHDDELWEPFIPPGMMDTGLGYAISTEPFTIAGHWEPDEMKIKPIAPARTKYGGKVYEFRGFIQAFPGGERIERDCSIWMPIRDRRLARRICRDTGKRFRMVNGYAQFRRGPR